MAMVIVTSRLFKPLVEDAPKMQRLAYENDRISDMLRQLRRDIDAADALPDDFEKITAGDSQLIIRQGQKLICYRIDGGKAEREVLQTGKKLKNTTPTLPETWELPTAKIRFQRWQDKQTGQAYAAEITSAVIYHKYEHNIEKLANAHVFFLNGLAGKLEAN